LEQGLSAGLFRFSLAGCCLLFAHRWQVKSGYRSSNGQFLDEEGRDVLGVIVDDKPVGRPWPVVTAMDQVEHEPIEWLWSGIAPLGKLTLIAGDPGVGKSLVTIDLAARVSRGGPFPGSPDLSLPAAAILVGEEDGLADTVRPRLEAASAQLNHVKAVQAVEQGYAVRDSLDDGDIASLVDFKEPVDLRRHPGVLTKAIDQTPNCRLVVIDPLSAYLPGTSQSEARRMLTRLAEVAARRQVALVAVTHFTKSAGDPLMYRPLGGLGALAVARSAWVIVREQETERRLMHPLKQNLRGSSAGLAFTIATEANGQPRIEWEEPCSPAATDADRQEQLAELIRQQGGQITVRALMRCDRQRYTTARQAEAVLAQLVAAGAAERRWQQPGERGGRPVEVFVVKSEE
jgi:hypothetical protein